MGKTGARTGTLSTQTPEKEGTTVSMKTTVPGPEPMNLPSSKLSNNNCSLWHFPEDVSYASNFVLSLWRVPPPHARMNPGRILPMLSKCWTTEPHPEPSLGVKWKPSPAVLPAIQLRFILSVLQARYSVPHFWEPFHFPRFVKVVSQKVKKELTSLWPAGWKIK